MLPMVIVVAVMPCVLSALAGSASKGMTRKATIACQTRIMFVSLYRCIISERRAGSSRHRAVADDGWHDARPLMVRPIGRPDKPETPGKPVQVATLTARSSFYACDGNLGSNSACSTW